MTKVILIGAGAVALLALASCESPNRHTSDSSNEVASNKTEPGVSDVKAEDNSPPRPCAFDKEIVGKLSQCEELSGVLSAINGPAINIEASRLSVAYIENQVSANDQFSLKKLIISGAVTRVSEYDGQISIAYAAPYEMPVDAALWRTQVWDGEITSDRSLAKHIASGQRLKMACDNRGAINDRVKLVNCVAIFTKDRPAKPEIQNKVSGRVQQDLSSFPNVVQQAVALDAECRGGQHGVDDSTCVARDKAFYDARDQGWCYGKDGDTEAQRVWRRCDS